jgi:hypothetical protein
VRFAPSNPLAGDAFEFVGFDWLDQNFGFPLSVPNEPIEYTADSGGGPILWASYTFYLPEAAPEPEPVDDGFGFGDPSVLSELPTAREAATPAQLGFAAGGAVVFGLLLTIPSRLLSDAKDRMLARLRPRLRAWWDKKRRRDVAATAPETRPVRRFDGWPLALAGLFVAAVLTVFIDPRAGFDLGTLRLAGSVFLAFAFDVLIGWLVLSLLVGRFVPGAVPRVRFKPWAFVLVVGAVLFTRVFHLEPGLTVGLVAGIVFAGTLAALQRVRLTLIVLGHGLVLSLFAWVAYSMLNGVGGAEPDGWLVFLRETLAAITVAGIVALPLALLPVRGLAGYELFRESRVRWAIAYGVGLMAFLVVLVPFPESWREVPISFVAWLGLFLAYVVVAVVTWLVVVKPWRPEEPDSEAALAVEVDGTSR